MTETAQAPTYLGLLGRNTDFRRLWLGQVVSFFGDWFKTIAMYTVVQQMTDSTLALSGVLVAMTLPIFLVVPIAGPIVDRFDRRTVMLATDVARAVLALGLLGAHLAGSLIALYVVLVLMTGVAGIFIPARMSVIPQLTEKAELPVAMALSGGTWSVMLAVGAAVGGVATQLIGVDGAFLLDALTFLVSFALLYPLPRLLPRESTGSGDDVGLLAGFRYVASRPYLLALLCNKPAMSLGGAILALVPIYGDGLFPLGGPLYLGLLYSARGLGALLGTMGVRRVIGDAPDTMRRALPVGFVVIAFAALALAVSPRIGWAALALLVLMIGQGTVWVFSGTLAQMASDRAYRGRVFSMEFGGLTLSTSIAGALAGWAVDSEWATVREVVGLTGLVMFLPAVAWMLYLRRIADDEVDEAMTEEVPKGPEPPV